MARNQKMPDNDKTLKCYLLKWKQCMIHRGWARYEVRPMPVVQDERYDVLEVNLTFLDANTRRAKMEEIEDQRVKAERQRKLMGYRGQ